MANSKKKKTPLEIDRLNHFLEFNHLLTMLKNKSILFTNPDRWQDKNDSEVLKKYKANNNFDKLFAFCCLSEEETIHHWSHYTSEEIGCCIQFDGQKLIERMKKITQIKQGLVSYYWINDIKKGSVEVDEYPFKKRKPYECEKEYRFIWGGKHPDNAYPVKISLDVIKRITLLPKGGEEEAEREYKNAKSKIEKLLNGQSIRISKSTIYRNPTWINKF